MFVEYLLCARHSARRSLYASLNRTDFCEGERERQRPGNAQL